MDCIIESIDWPDSSAKSQFVTQDTEVRRIRCRRNMRPDRKIDELFFLCKAYRLPISQRINLYE